VSFLGVLLVSKIAMIRLWGLFGGVSSGISSIQSLLEMP
jgi:hypothetical protein